MKNLEEIGDYIAAQKLELAAKNLQHLMKIQAEQTSLQSIVTALSRMLADARNCDTEDFGTMLANQSNMLDATFLYFLDLAARSPHSHDDKVNMALKAQRQVERSIRTWRLLSEQKKILRTK